MSEKAKGFNMKYVHFAVTFAFMFLFRFVPPVGTITPYGMAVIGIFIGLIYGWSVDADNLCWTSLLGIVALGVTDFGNAAFSSVSDLGGKQKNACKRKCSRFGFRKCRKNERNQNDFKRYGCGGSFS